MNATSTTNQTPYIIAGSGELVSHVYRTDYDDCAKYSFNVFKSPSDGGVTQLMGPEDLRDIVKVCQVLAFLILDDGRESDELNDSLLELNLQLDTITSKWSETDG